MSQLRSFKRGLDPSRVALAKRTEEKWIKLARLVEKVKKEKDAAFVADVLKRIEELLPKEIKDVAEETVASASLASTNKKLDIKSQFC